MSLPVPRITSEHPIKEGEIITAKDEIRVLHIEDEPRFAEMVAEFLHRENDAFTVLTATDPQEGLELFEDDPVDCIVSDYDMPGLNGLDVLKEVRSESHSIPFILFTGKGTEEIASEAVSAGVTEYLQKGSGTDQYTILANRIENAVARHTAERQMVRGFSAIETAYDGIALLNDDGEFVYVNKAYADITGYDREELLGNHWEMLYRESDLDTVYDEILPQARREKWTGRTVCVTKGDEAITVDHTLAYTEGDSLICTISEIDDVEEIEAELSLKERAMDEAPFGITIADATREDEPLVYANDGFLQLTGYEKEEVLGRNCRFLQGENTADEPVGKMRAAIEAGESVSVEVRNYRKDGTEFRNRVWIAPLRDDEGQVTHYVGFQEDITDRIESDTNRGGE